MDLLVGVLACTSSCSLGGDPDELSRAVTDACADRGCDVVAYHVCPQETECIEASLVEMCDVDEVRLVFTVGGTGLALTQIAPETTRMVATRMLPGIAEAMRAGVKSEDWTGLLARVAIAQRNRTLIVNLPEHDELALECLAWVLDRAAGYIEAMDCEDTP